MFYELEILEKWRIHMIFVVSNAIQEKLGIFKKYKKCFFTKSRNSVYRTVTEIKPKL